MRLHKRVEIICLTLVLVQVLSGFAQTQQPQREKFRYERVIFPGGAGPNRLRIDVPLLAGARPFREMSRQPAAMGQEPVIVARNGLDDLRIYDSAGHETPYVLVEPKRSEPAWAEGRLLSVPATKTTSGFELDLGQSLQVDRLRLGGLPTTFLKSYRLEASGDGNRWTVLAVEGKLFDLGTEKLRQLDLEFEPGEYRYFRLAWDDSTSAPIPPPAAASARLVSAGALPSPLLRAPLPFERLAGVAGVSRYRLRLPGRHLPLTDLEVVSAGTSVLRKVRVTEAPPSEVERAPHTIGMASLWHMVSGRSELRIPITAPQQEELELIISDGESPPLELTGVSAIFASLPWIYFESPGKEPLTARFGLPDLAAPRYEHVVEADSISTLRSEEARWGEMRDGSGFPRRTRVLWAILALAVLAAFVVIMRLVRNGAWHH